MTPERPEPTETRLPNRDASPRRSRPALQGKHITVRYGGGEPAIENCNFDVAGGEFVSLVGPSGCGKSTLLKAIAGLIPIDAGELLVGGRPPDLSRAAARVAYVFQEPTLLPWRTVIDNIRLPLELRGVDRAQQRQSVEESLSLIGLSHSDRRKRPRELSGGMKMRVSLARALVTDPEVLLLDEPFAALDDVLRQQLNEDLCRLWGERHWTAVFVTHNVAEAVFLSQRVLVMSSRPGRILAEVAIPFPYPRRPELRGTAEFAKLTAEISQQLRGGDVSCV